MQAILKTLAATYTPVPDLEQTPYIALMQSDLAKERAQAEQQQHAGIPGASQGMGVEALTHVRGDVSDAGDAVQQARASEAG